MVSLELGAPVLPGATALPGGAGGTWATPETGGAPGAGGTACPAMTTGVAGTNGGLGMEPLNVVIGVLSGTACPGCNDRCLGGGIWPGIETGGAGGAPGKGGRVLIEVSRDIPAGIYACCCCIYGTLG